MNNVTIPLHTDDILSLLQNLDCWRLLQVYASPCHSKHTKIMNPVKLKKLRGIFSKSYNPHRIFIAGRRQPWENKRI